MTAIRPNQLVLRCMAHRQKGRWVGVCLDLNLGAEADSLEELKSKMDEFVSSYIATVLDTDDRASVSDLISRKAPWKDWLKYYALRLHLFVRKLPDRLIFKEYIPFELSHNC